MCAPPQHQALSAGGPKGDLVTQGLWVYEYAAEHLPARCLWIDSCGRSAGDWFPGRKELLASLAGGVQSAWASRLEYRMLWLLTMLPAVCFPARWVCCLVNTGLVAWIMSYLSPE